MMSFLCDNYALMIILIILMIMWEQSSFWFDKTYTVCTIMAVLVFGIIASLSSREGTITFIGFLILIVLIEKGLHFLEHAIALRGLDLLFNKLKNELMLMGLISFAVLIYNIANAGEHFGSQAVTDAFEMSHIMTFFIAISFIIQASFLVIYALTIGRRYQRSLRTNSEQLLEAYERIDDLKATDVEAKNQWWWFHEGNPLFPPYPAFRFDIEFRMLERLFIHQHNLSPGNEPFNITTINTTRTNVT